MTNIREENYKIICKRIQELVDLLQNDAEPLSQDQWNDIVNRITKLNKMLEHLKHLKP